MPTDNWPPTQLAVERTKGLAVLAQNVRRAAQRGDDAATLDELAALIRHAGMVQEALQAELLGLPGDFEAVVESARILNARRRDRELAAQVAATSAAGWSECTTTTTTGEEPPK